MRKHTGFTLIELVIVIVLLGILGAVATPRLFSLISDSHKTNLQVLHKAIQTAATIGNAKAILNGFSHISPDLYPKADSKNNFKLSLTGDIHYAYGYPDASGNGIIKMLEETSAYSSEENNSTYTYTHTDDTFTTLRISLRGRGYRDLANDAAKCELTYQQPSAPGQAPVIKLFSEGC